MVIVKSPFERFVNKSQSINDGHTNEESGIFTIPTVAMTIPRPLLAAKSAEMLIKGKNPVTPLVALTFATDMEGMPGRWLDEQFPDLRIGTSTFGAKADIVADTLALIEIGSAALIAPRMPHIARLSVATTLGVEGFKSIWALRKNAEYRNSGGDGNLYIPPTNEGKCSMAEKMTALGLAVLSSDFDKISIRQPIAITSMAFAIIGSARGEQERQDYENIANIKISELNEIVHNF